MNRTITFTPRELEMIMTALDTHTATLMREPRASALQADEINEFNELRDGVLAESAGHHDDWPGHIHVNDSDDLVGRTFRVSGDDFIKAGIRAREALKASRHGGRAFGDSDIRTGSMAASRRRMKLSDKS